MRLLVGFAASMIISAAAAEPAVVDKPGEAEKAAAISKLEADIEAATEQKTKAAKDDDRAAVKRLTAELKRLRLELSKAKTKTPEQHAEDAAEWARVKEAARLEAEKKQEEGRQKWYEGGTLHKKTVAEWSKATQRDKVATSADFVTHAWKAGILKDFIANGIGGMDDIKPLAERLASEIDLFYAKGQLAGGSDVALAAAKVMDRRWTKPQ